jgi:hypothetical protein
MSLSCRTISSVGRTNSTVILDKLSEACIYAAIRQQDGVLRGALGPVNGGDAEDGSAVFRKRNAASEKKA